MRENDENDQYLPQGQPEKERLFVEIPATLKRPYPERLPSGYDPIQSIRLEGRAFRGLAEGRIPWWVLISGWAFFGGMALLWISLGINVRSTAIFFPLLSSTLLLIILWRGTTAKISFERQRKRRR